MQRDAEGTQIVDRSQIPQVVAPGRSLMERLAAEILPRLERPGRELLPLVRVPRPQTNPAEVVAVWTATTGPRFEDLATRWTSDVPHPSAWLTTPSHDYAALLSARRLPLCTRPGWHPLRDHPVCVVLLDEALEIFDLLALAASSANGRDLPPLVALGAGVGPLSKILPSCVDLAVEGGEPRAAFVEIARAISRGTDFADALRAWGQRQGAIVHEGDRRGTPWPSWPQIPPAGKPYVPVFGDRLLGPEDLAQARVDVVPLGAGGRRAEVWLLSAAGRRREELSIEWTPRSDREFADAVAQEWMPLRLHLAAGLPGDGEEDLAGLAELLNELRTAVGPERRLEIQLHPYWDPEGFCPDPTDLRNFQRRVEDLGRPHRVRVRPARELLPLLHAALAQHGEGAWPLVRRVFEAGATGAQSKLATDPDLWHKSMQEAQLEPPQLESWPRPGGRRDAGVAPGLSLVPRAPEVPAIETDAMSRRWQRWQALVPRRFDVRVVYRTQGLVKFLSQGELGAIVARRCREGDLPLATTGRVEPKLRMSFGPHLASGIEGVQEYLDLSFLRKVAGDDLVTRLSDGLPEDLEILAVIAIPPGQPQLALSKVALAEYEVSLEPEGPTDPDACRLLLSELPLRVRALRESMEEGAEASIEDLHHQLHDVRLSTEGTAAARLVFALDLADPGPKRKPHDFLGLLLGDLVEDVRTLPIRRTGLFVRDESQGTPRWLTPAEMLARANRRIREAEKTCA